MDMEWDPVQADNGDVTMSNITQPCVNKCGNFIVQPETYQVQKVGVNPSLCTSCWRDASPKFMEDMVKQYKETMTARQPGFADQKVLNAMHQTLLHLVGVPLRKRDEIHREIMEQWKNHGVKCNLDHYMIVAGCTSEMIKLACDLQTRAMMNDYF